MQNIFGPGVLFATPLYDAYGNAISNPSPVQFGVSQEASIDISFDTKQLYGQNQFPVAIGRGKGKATGKFKFAQLNGALLNSVVFGQTLTAGLQADVYDTTGAAIPGTPFQITPTVPNSGTWLQDLGVRSSTGVPLTRVASGPTTGQYAVAAGVYTFASADTGLTVFINYQYTATSTTAKKSTVLSIPMGLAPSFRADIYFPYNGKTATFTFNNCVANKLSLSSKLDDFMVPELDFDIFADTSNNLFTYALSE